MVTAVATASTGLIAVAVPALAATPCGEGIAVAGGDASTRTSALITSPFQATGGTSVYAWRIATCSLPTGLALSSTGAITGTPRTADTRDFTVVAQDTAVPP